MSVFLRKFYSFLFKKTNFININAILHISLLSMCQMKTLFFYFDKEKKTCLFKYKLKFFIFDKNFFFLHFFIEKILIPDFSLLNLEKKRNSQFLIKCVSLYLVILVL